MDPLYPIGLSPQARRGSAEDSSTLPTMPKAATTPPMDEEELLFEEALERLEKSVERIEEGELGLEAAMAEFEKGMKLIERCRGVLDRAEVRIAELSVGDDGVLEEQAAGEA